MNILYKTESTHSQPGRNKTDLVRYIVKSHCSRKAAAVVVNSLGYTPASRSFKVVKPVKLRRTKRAKSLRERSSRFS